MPKAKIKNFIVVKVTEGEFKGLNEIRHKPSNKYVTRHKTVKEANAIANHLNQKFPHLTAPVVDRRSQQEIIAQWHLKMKELNPTVEAAPMKALRSYKRGGRLTS